MATEILDNFIDKMRKELEKNKPNIESIYQEMGKYKHAHLKFEQRLGFIQDILDEISATIEATDGKEGEARVFEEGTTAQIYICRINDAIMKLMLSYADLRNEIEHCHSMWMSLKGELNIITAQRDYVQERLDVFNNNK